MYRSTENIDGGLDPEQHEDLKKYFLYYVLESRPKKRTITASDPIPDKESAITQAREALLKAANSKQKFRQAFLLSQVLELDQSEEEQTNRYKTRFIWECNSQNLQGYEIQGEWEEHEA